MVHEPREIRLATGNGNREADDNVGSPQRTQQALSREVAPLLSGPPSDRVVARGDGSGSGDNLAARVTANLDPVKDSASPIEKLIGEKKFIDARPQTTDQTQVTDRRTVSDSTTKTPEVHVQYSNLTQPAAAQKPDFIVKANGDIVAMRDFEKAGGNVVIQVERAEGQLDPSQNPAQKEATERLVAYVNSRIKQDYPEAEKNGVALKDDQGLVAPEVENALGMRNATNIGDNYSPDTQKAVENLRRFNGSGQGSMSRDTADGYFPQRDVPMQPGETNTAAAFKDTVAALFNANKERPYETVRKQNNEYRVGRYGMSGRQISNWLAGLDLGDPPDPAKIEELIKAGKLPKGFNVAQLNKLQAMAKGMGEGKEPSAEDMKLLPKEMQETMATDMTGKLLKDAGGDNSIAALAWMQNKEVGQLTQADLSSPEGVQIRDAAQKAFSLATGRQMSEKGDTIHYKDNGEGSPLGMQIANSAERVANNMGSVGWCFRGVKAALRPHGINLEGGLAKQAASQLANHPRVQEVAKNDIQPGDILVHQPAGHGRTKGQQYAGHIAVYLGNGKEASDHVQPLIKGQGYGGTRAFRVMSA